MNPERLPPISWFLLIGLLAMMSVSFGGRPEKAISFFVILSAILLLFHFVSREEILLDEDLKNLDEEGHPRYGLR